MARDGRRGSSESPRSAPRRATPNRPRHAEPAAPRRTGRAAPAAPRRTGRAARGPCSRPGCARACPRPRCCASPSAAGCVRAGPQPAVCRPVRGRRSRASASIKGKSTRKEIQPRAFALDRRTRRGDTPCRARRAAPAPGSEIKPRAYALDRRQQRPRATAAGRGAVARRSRAAARSGGAVRCGAGRGGAGRGGAGRRAAQCGRTVRSRGVGRAGRLPGCGVVRWAWRSGRAAEWARGAAWV
jgi:hypothetical protein